MAGVLVAVEGDELVGSLALAETCRRDGGDERGLTEPAIAALDLERLRSCGFVVADFEEQPRFERERL